MSKKAKARVSGVLSWVAVISFLTLAAFVVSQNLSLYQANISMKPKLLFDGTALPLREVPDWVNTPAQEWKLTYGAISSSRLAALPEYDPGKLSRSADSLEWGNSYHDLIRNMKITFSVPYMGNYKLDGGEYSGSHLAVDIKTLIGTPVYSIANGIVVKASNQSSGFGKHVVIRHDNAPLPSGGKGTIYSSYSHLSSFSVEEGDDIRRGEKIGAVGDTGTATTPHLHFQIDTETAPWHPYWPFTSKEASDAGYSFFDAINNGLGRDRAIANTINPMEFVQDNLVDGEQTGIDDIEVEEDQDVSDDLSDSNSVANDEEVGRVIFYHDRSYTEGEKIIFRVKILDEDANDVLDPKFSGSIALGLKDDIGRLKDVLLMARDFDDGVAEVEINTTTPGSTRLIAEYEGEKYSSELFTILPEDLNEATTDEDDDEDVSGGEVDIEIRNDVSELQIGDRVEFTVLNNGNGVIEDDLSLELNNEIAELDSDVISEENIADGRARVLVDAEAIGEFRLIVSYGDEEFVSEEINVVPAPTNLDSFEIVHDGYFLEGVEETITVMALNGDGDLIEDFVPVLPVNLSLAKGDGEFSRDVLVPGSFKGGVAEFGFVSDSESAAVIEVVHGKVVSESEPLTAGLYSDVGIDNEYYKAIKYLSQEGVVQGYDDGSFRPDDPIARVEVLKMILAALDYDLERDGYVDFSDVSLEAWYSPYLVTAVDTGIIDGYPDRTFRPANTVINAEFFKMLVMASGDELEKDLDEKPYRDVDTDLWYAPHAEYVRSKRLIDSSETYFRADDVISRGQVADAIYRVLKIQEHGVKYYRSNLR